VQPDYDVSIPRLTTEFTLAVIFNWLENFSLHSCFLNTDLKIHYICIVVLVTTKIRNTTEMAFNNLALLNVMLQKPRSILEMVNCIY
jgi:hypothetical protein